MRRRLCVALLVTCAVAEWGVREALETHREQSWWLRIQQDLDGHRVVVYSKTKCPHSLAVKRLLRSLDTSFYAIELDQIEGAASVQAELKKISGVATVPQVFIDGQFVGTADGTRAAMASGQLERLLRTHELCRDNKCTARCDVHGNLGASDVILNRGTNWLKARWQAASDMGGTAIKGPHLVEIDFGQEVNVCTVEIDWETAYADDYTIDADGERVFDSAALGATRTVRTSGASPALPKRPLHVVHNITLDGCTRARNLAIHIARGATPWGVSIWHVGFTGSERAGV